MCDFGGLFGGGASGPSPGALQAQYTQQMATDEEKARRERERDLKRQADTIRYGAQRAAAAARGTGSTFSAPSQLQRAMFQVGKPTLGGGA